MEQIIKEVLEAEKNVNQIIQNAREKANALKQDCEKETTDKLTDARQKAQQLIHETVESAREDAGKIREHKLLEAEKNRREFIEKNKKTLDKFVREVTRRIITTGYEQGAR